MEPQPPTLAQTLNIVLETYREQRKRIQMLTKKTPVNKQDLEENSQPSPILPLVAPQEVNQHQMGIPAPVDKVSDMDLSDWEITCTEFRPRQRKHASKPIGAGAHPT